MQSILADRSRAIATGVVTASCEAVVALSLSSPDGAVKDIEAVIDTGDSGFLTLPPRVVEELGLPFVTNAHAILANGSEETFGVHSVLGMRLLDQCDLYVQVRGGGRVRIETPNQLVAGRLR